MLPRELSVERRDTGASGGSRPDVPTGAESDAQAEPAG